MRLSKDDILKAEDNAPEEVDCPEWGGTVLVRGMTGRERDAFETSLLQPGRQGRREVNTANLRAKMVARCVVDDDGNRLFTDADAVALGERNAAAVLRVFMVAARLSGWGDEAKEDMTQDFELADGDGSPSTSPAASTRRSKDSSPR